MLSLFLSLRATVSKADGQTWVSNDTLTSIDQHGSSQTRPRVHLHSSRRGQLNTKQTGFNFTESQSLNQKRARPQKGTWLRP